MPIVLAIALAVGGWIVPWQREAGVASVDRAQGGVGDVFLFAGQLDVDGHPRLEGRPETWPEVVSRARKRGARVWLTIVNDRVGPSGPPILKDAEVVHRAIGQPDPRARHRAEIVALAQQLGADGVDLDYESLPASEREAFSTFVSELSADLHAAGLALSVTVQPKRGDTSARGPGAMDWPRLCRTADRVQVMLYNEHNAQTDPGPVAGIDWMSEVIDYALGSCPVAKIVPVLKVSGMDWGPGRAEWRSFAEVTAIRREFQPRIRRERRSKVPWFVYAAPDGRHVVYFEDARSLKAKADRLRARGLRTLVLWSLGSEDPESVSRLQNR